MEAIFVVIVVLAVLVFSMTLALAWLDRAYDELTGRPSREPRLAWLRSMNAGGTDATVHAQGISLLERVVMVSVYIAMISFLIWFFFFAGSPLPT